MKLEFFKRGAVEQALVIRETAARRGLLPVMVEKDFWVSWNLAVLFGHPEFGAQLVFKGGTSISKVFVVIGRCLIRICGSAWRIGRGDSSRRAGHVTIWPDLDHRHPRHRL